MIEFYNIVKLALQAKLGRKVRAMVKFMPRLLRQQAGVNRKAGVNFHFSIKTPSFQDFSEFPEFSAEKHLRNVTAKQLLSSRLI